MSSSERRRSKNAFTAGSAVHSQGAAWMLPIPATFVIARDGIVTARFIDPDFRRRMSVEELIAALEAASKRGRGLREDEGAGVG